MLNMDVFRPEYLCRPLTSSRIRILKYLYTCCISITETLFPFARQSFVISASIMWIFWCLPIRTSFTTLLFSLFRDCLVTEWNTLVKHVCINTVYIRFGKNIVWRNIHLFAIQKLSRLLLCHFRLLRQSSRFHGFWCWSLLIIYSESTLEPIKW